MGKLKIRLMQILVAVYVAGVVVVTGLAHEFMMPAMNWKGEIYLGLTWPVALSCYHINALSEREVCSNVPPMWLARHFFTFDSQETASDD